MSTYHKFALSGSSTRTYKKWYVENFRNHANTCPFGARRASAPICDKLSEHLTKLRKWCSVFREGINTTVILTWSTEPYYTHTVHTIHVSLMLLPKFRSAHDVEQLWLDEVHTMKCTRWNAHDEMHTMQLMKCTRCWAAVSKGLYQSHSNYLWEAWTCRPTLRVSGWASKSIDHCATRIMSSVATVL